MIPVQISTKLEGKAYTATLRCVVKGKEHTLRVEGRGEPKDSRQRLELLAITDALKHMTKPSAITIKASGYVKTGLDYLQEWQNAGWKRTNGKRVANEDLWQQMAEATKIHKITIFLI